MFSTLKFNILAMRSAQASLVAGGESCVEHLGEVITRLERRLQGREHGFGAATTTVSSGTITPSSGTPEFTQSLHFWWLKLAVTEAQGELFLLFVLLLLVIRLHGNSALNSAVPHSMHASLSLCAGSDSSLVGAALHTSGR